MCYFGTTSSARVSTSHIHTHRYLNEELPPVDSFSRNHLNNNTNTPISLYYHNAGGLRTKTNELFSHAGLHEFNIVALVETWLTSHFLNSELFDSYYHIYRNDRSLNSNVSRGGGVLIAVAGNLASREISLPINDNSIEQICVAVNFGEYICQEKNEMVFLLSYIPPKSDDSIYSNHISNINYIINSLKPYQTPCVLGDFNLGNIEWHFSISDQYLIPFNVNHDIEALVCDNIYSLELFQINNVQNDIHRILDLIFIKNDFKYKLQKCDTPLTCDSIHHKAIVMNFSFYSYAESFYNPEIQYDYKHANFIAINLFFDSIDWKLIFGAGDLYDIYSIFKQVVNYAIYMYIPLKKQLRHFKLPWHNKRLMHLKNLRTKAHKKYKSTNLACDKALFSLRCKEFECLSNFLYKNYIYNIESNIKQNSKSFWTFYNIKRKSSGYPTCMEYDGVTVNGTNLICNSFAKFFSSVYNINPEFNNQNFSHLQELFDVGHLEFDVNEVLQALRTLDASKSAGYDTLPPLFLKECAQAISLPLTMIFNKSLSSAVFLQEWKMSYISPIFKSGQKGLITSYRPIVKLSAIPKLLDKLVNNKLFSIVKNSIDTRQHGFYSGRSTTTNLAIFCNYCISAVENGLQTDVLYTDFIKAFDRVNHDVLIYKLKMLGIHSNMLNWIYSYLSNRTLFVKIDNCISEPIYANSGVPQGSHLGPLLFLLLINDIPSVFKFCNILLYADDLKMYSIIRNMNDCMLFQKDIDTFLEWCLYNGMELNFSKCKILTISHKKFPLVNNYTFYNNTIDREMVMRDLGVYIDSKFSFSHHLEYVINKANSQLGFLKRNSTDFKDPYTVRILYFAFVRSQLEYCDVIWDPSYNTYKCRIERVQRRFSKFALRNLYSSFNMPSYETRCQLLNLNTLTQRRVAHNIMFIKNVIDSTIDSPELLQQIPINVPRRNLRDHTFFYVHFHRYNYSLNEVITRCLTLCNNACNHLDFIANRLIFKSRLFEYINLDLRT